MKISCILEHNGSDSLLYAADLPGAYTRGKTPETALQKMEAEIRSYLRWMGKPQPDKMNILISQDVSSELDIADADSDVLFYTEKDPLTQDKYVFLKQLTLKSAADFLMLYESIPDKHRSSSPARRTFYGKVPATAEEMYLHTRNVNAYYFGEIDIEADNEGTILSCRERGFAALEQQLNYLNNPVLEGSYGESWSLRKLLRRFLWHDRIHAKAMYRMALREFGSDAVPNPFFFEV